MKFNTIKNNIKNYLELSKNLYHDKETPLISRILLGAGICYLVSPIDLIPDFIPVIGQLDDALIVPALFLIAIKFIPKSLYKKHYNQLFE